MEHIIDCDAEPFNPAPDDWKVEEHRKGGSFKWDPRQVQFYVSVQQKRVDPIRGSDLRKELADKPVLNANVLDYLLAHPDLTEEWKEYEKDQRFLQVFFWGTIYHRSRGTSVVRSLLFDRKDKSVISAWQCIKGDLFESDLWYSNQPAALRAN